MPSTEPLRVGVFGAGGKMGQTICAAVAAAPDLALVAAVDPHGSGEQLAFGPDATPLRIATSPEVMAESGVQVAVDFTVAAAAPANLEFCLAHGLHAVCGTTGIAAETLAALSVRFSEADAPNCVLAPNFAISAVILMRLAALAAPFFDNIEVIELHHDHKRDAPSGTAVATADAIEAARRERGAGELGADPTTEQTLPGTRGARTGGGVHVHSVRLAGLVAHEEVLFGTTGQSLTIRQDSYDRSSFVPGVLLAVRRVAETPGFTTGLADLLGL